MYSLSIETLPNKNSLFFYSSWFYDIVLLFMLF